MVSYHFINSCFVLEPSRFCSSMFDKMSQVSLTGMFVYKFVMSREASVKWGRIGVFFNLPISSRVFSMLCVLGRGASCLIFCVNSLASLYAGAFLQLTTGLMGRLGLYILIRPLMVGADGFMLTSFHLDSCGIKTLLSFIVS